MIALQRAWYTLSGLVGSSALALASSACASVTGPQAPRTGIPSAASWVTPSVLMHLDADGRFVFGDVPEGNARATISAQRAREIANAFVNTFLRRPLTMVLPGAEDPREILERVHGKPIRWTELRPVTTTVYPMISPVAGVGASVSTADLSRVGARYHVLFGARGVIVIDVMVSAYATDVVLSSDGTDVIFLGSTDAIRVDGLAASAARDLAIIPEIAVESVGRRGRLVAALPDLIMPWGGLTTLSSRWRIRLDSSIAVAFLDGGGISETDVLYVGFLPDSAGLTALRWYVSADAQPVTDRIRVIGDDRTVREVVVNLSPDYPTRYREVRVPPPMEPPG